MIPKVLGLVLISAVSQKHKLANRLLARVDSPHLPKHLQCRAASAKAEYDAYEGLYWIPDY